MGKKVSFIVKNNKITTEKNNEQRSACFCQVRTIYHGCLNPGNDAQCAITILFGGESKNMLLADVIFELKIHQILAVP